MCITCVLLAAAPGKHRYEAVKAAAFAATECERTEAAGIAATAAAGCCATFVNKLADWHMPASIAELQAQAVAFEARSMTGTVAHRPNLPPLLPIIKTLPFGCLAFVALEYGRDLSDVMEDALE